MIRGKVRECAPTRIEHTVNANIHNRFDIEVRDAKTNKLKQKAQAFNVICDNYWQYTSSSFKYIAYGNGTGTPSASDTKLFGSSFGYATVNGTTVGTDISSGVSYRKTSVVLDETVAVGVNITEVGLSSQNKTGYLCTHAMLQDMNGNPISIVKTDTDIVTIYATVYVHWNPSDQNGVTLCSPLVGTEMSNFVGFALGLGLRNYYTSNLGTSSYHAKLRAGVGTTTLLSHPSAGWDSVAWDRSTKTYTCKFHRAAVDDLNVDGGFGWLSFEYASGTAHNRFCVLDVRGEYEVSGEAVGTGDGATTRFATKFEMPTNAVVYVDGVKKTHGVTVNPHPLRSDAMDYMLHVQITLFNGKPCYLTGPMNMSPGYYYTFYNPLYMIGVDKFSSSKYSSYIDVGFSDDLVNWSPYYSTGTAIPEEYRHCKYIRCKNTHSSESNSTANISATFPSGISTTNIVFDEPPAEGAVITIDYVTPFVPKDTNHVYDVSIAVKYGEYTGS